MNKLIYILSLSLLMFSCDGGDSPDSKDEVITELETHIEETSKMQSNEILSSRNINVSDDSMESYILVAAENLFEFESYFPTQQNETCKSNSDESFNLNEDLDAIHLNKVAEGNILKLDKLEKLNIQALADSGYSRYHLTTIVDRSGSELVFYRMDGEDTDVPIIYGESDVRDSKIENNAFGINLLVQDAYLVFRIEGAAKTKNLYLLAKADSEYNICNLPPVQDPKLLKFACDINDGVSKLYTKCLKD